MPTKRFTFGSVRERGPDAITNLELVTPASITPDIVIYFANNGYALHSFKKGKPYVVIATERDDLIAEIKSLLKRGE